MPDLLERVSAGRLDPVYVIGSDHPLLVERAVHAIREAAVPPAVRGFNYDVIDAKKASAQRILAAAQTLPMMAATRMVLVRDLADLNAAELTRLLPYFDAPNPSTVLVCITSKIDKRTKFYAAAGKKKFLHELGAPRDLAPWVAAEARARRVGLAPGAADRLVEAVGKDLSRLALALEQLALYAGDRDVTGDDVDDLIADTRERSVFELINAIGAGDLSASLAAVASLCEQRQSPIGVVVMLGRFMRQLGMCHVAQAQRLRQADSARLIGVPPYLVKKLMAQSRRYAPAALARASRRLAETDRQLKGQDDSLKVLGRELGERVLLDRLVTDLVRLGRSA
ncbi:DNA polymerase III subunit delta [Haliangium sp.]|uniref:DNA polymerase III subunit delta n=1 Tax=Haliangium sp. TaxID=2663208 RepID=UPI003D114866